MQTNHFSEHHSFKGFWSSINLLDQKQRKEIVLQLLSELSSEDRAVISLFYFENLSVSEISTVMEANESYIQQTLKNLIVSVRDLVQKSDQKVNTLLH